MTIESCTQALLTVLGTALVFQTVARGDTRRLAADRSSVIPDPNDCPYLRLIRGLTTEKGMTITGHRERRIRYACELWVYFPPDVEPTQAADNFLDLVAQGEAAVRDNRDLLGLADTDETQLLQARVVEEAPTPRPFTNGGKGMGGLRTAFMVECWEKQRAA